MGLAVKEKLYVFRSLVVGISIGKTEVKGVSRRPFLRSNLIVQDFRRVVPVRIVTLYKGSLNTTRGDRRVTIRCHEVVAVRPPR